jgi:hypothetical protein
VVGHLVGAQAQRADVGVVSFALEHVRPFEIVMADMAFQMPTIRINHSGVVQTCSVESTLMP